MNAIAHAIESNEVTWRVVGYQKREPVQICPGVTHPNTATCMRCAQSIRIVVTVESSTGERMEVGQDCAYTLQGGIALRDIRAAQRAWEREEDERLHGAERRERAAQRERERQAAVAEALVAYAKELADLDLVASSPTSSEWERAWAESRARLVRNAGDYPFSSEDERAKLAAMAFRARLPPPKHLDVAAGTRVRGLEVILLRVFHFETAYGTTFVSSFATDDGAVIVWKGRPAFVGDRPVRLAERVRMTGTVKAHSEYRGSPQTLVSRCKLEVAS